MDKNERLVAVLVMYGLALGNILQWAHNKKIMDIFDKAEKELDETIEIALKLAEFSDYSEKDRLISDLKFLQVSRAERKIKDQDRPVGLEEE